MPKEVLLYGDIYSWSAREFMIGASEAGKDDLVVRVNSNGGEVRYGWGIIAKFKEHQGKKLVKNDGIASSMSAFFFCYADDAESIDTGEFNFHRAAYMFEDNELLFTPEDKARLATMNKNLRAAMEAKIDVAKFNALGKGTLDEMFSMDDRKLITLTAQEALEVGLINRVVKITPERKEEIEARTLEAVAQYHPKPIHAKNSTPNTKPMDINELKEKHQDVYKAAVAEAMKKEKARVEAWMAFNDVDATAVQKGIESGEEISTKQIIELSRKQFSADALKDLGKEGAPALETGAAGTGGTPEAKTAEAKKKADDLAAFEKAADARLGLTKEAK